MIATTEHQNAQTSNAGNTADQDVILGFGLVLSSSRTGGHVVHTFRAGEARRVGSFETAAEAWAAIDQFDVEGI